MQKMLDMDLQGLRLLIRQDLNVPLESGRITSDARIRAALPTIHTALERGAGVMLMSHLGRPQAGVFQEEWSLAPVARYLSDHLKQPVALLDDWLSGVAIQPGSVVLCENVRFNVGETDNDAVLAQKMASLCDLFVMDAFGTAHRAHASTHGVANYAPSACAGPLLVQELEALSQALSQPQKPLAAIVGGAKVSSKLDVLEAMSKQVDLLIVGGGIANTFLAAEGFPIGKSLYEADLMAQASRIMVQALNRGVDFPLPVDVVVTDQCCAEGLATIKSINNVSSEDIIVDVGPQTAQNYSNRLSNAKTIVWNGPLGVFEIPQFAAGTQTIGQAIADSKAFSLAGGGDTLAAIDQYGLAAKLSYISTGGGAFLEFLQGETLPAVAVLEQRAL